MRWRATVLLALVACAGDRGDDGAVPPSTTTTTVATTTTTTAVPTTIIAVRLERAVHDETTADFAAVVGATLADTRGWARAGFTFEIRDDAPYTIVLAEGPDVDARCAPYDTGGRYSCQRGPVVALNADRWRTATPQWTGDLGDYRRMLINHEVGHLLGQHHPIGGCTTPGAPAPVMVQQSTNLDGCTANPWPLDWEVTCAASGVEPIAPPYEPDAQPVCGP